MRFNDIVAWYQKKLSTNDKQPWEQTVEQRILGACTQFPLKSTKLKTGLIDVDLVRGSTFPKAKPKQSLFTILYLAIVRLLFLPLYTKWWVNQTSPKIFAVLLLLYFLQMLSWGIYSYSYHQINVNTEHIVNISEMLIPMALSLYLSIVHSQIVATSDIGHTKKRQKERSSSKCRKREKYKRRRKNLRMRFANPAVTKASSNPELDVNSQLLVNNTAPTEDTQRSDKTSLNKCPDAPSCSQALKIDVNVTAESSIRKRLNVGWGSPIRSNAIVIPDVAVADANAEPTVTIDDDGFESFNGKSSSGEENNVNRVPEMKDALAGTPEAGNSDTDTIVQSVDNPSNFYVAKSSQLKRESTDTDGESDEGATVSSPGISSSPPFTESTGNEWIGITTNSEECSYSSEIEQSDELSEDGAYILNVSCGTNDRISCTIWDGREIKKAELSIIEISSLIINRVESMPESCDYIYIGLVLSLLLSLLPAFCRLREATFEASNSTDINLLDMPVILLEKVSFSLSAIVELAFGNQMWERTVSIISFVQRLILTFLFFFLLTVAEKTFKQRFLYAKLFSHLTSSRRARKSNIPHFRLNKVRNIKTWLSVRSYLKRRGPQRSVDMIVSAAFMITLLLVAFLSVEWLKESVHIHTQLNLEALMWSVALGIFLLRFMTLGQKINKKYRSVSVLITEQINLYVQIEQKPEKKEEFMVANSVLKLAADLLKELESPFKISGLSANPYLYTTIKVVILSAMSGVLSEMLGFKLKLHKIKIK